LTSVQERIDDYDWNALTAEMNAHGCAVLPGLLNAPECGMLAALYADDKNFRSRIHMARHGFGKGEYKYFRYPCPS
jgi:uncharacterized protein